MRRQSRRLYARRSSRLSDRIEKAADRLARARLELLPLARLPDDLRPRDEAEAYAVQHALHRRLAAAGLGHLMGHKIGCTTPVMQAYLAIDHPCAGGMFASTAHREHADLDSATFIRLGVECEIAVRLGADFSASTVPYDRESVAGRVTTCVAAIELVDDRYEDYRSLDAPTLIADDFFHAGCVLGREVEYRRPLDLAALTGRMIISGEEVGRGRGSDILGHPFEALAWLANQAAHDGQPLRSGEVVLLGSIVRTVWLRPGDHVSIEIERLGKASLTLR
jgi:2-keto-4-pentenoate hydratase